MESETQSPSTAMNDHSHSHSDHACGFVPPYIFEALLQSRGASDEQRSDAQETLNVSQSLRQQRLDVETLDVSQALPPGTPNIQVYDWGTTKEQLAREQDSPKSKDRVVNSCFNGLSTVYEFFSKVFGHTSMPLKGYVHYTSFDRSINNYMNAIFFNKAVYFGDGDEDTLNYFANGLDVIAHEVVHGITESFMLKNATSGPPYITHQNQTGALNESLSDVFASMIEQYRRQQTVEQADWLLGEGIISVNSKMAAIRSMKAPGEAYRNSPVFGSDPQPRHMNKYNFTTGDNGGVHINSGIPNHAFYLAATRIGGYSWEGAGKIWWAAYTKFPAGCDFAKFASLTVDAATGHQRDVVRKVWEDVGVLQPVQIPPGNDGQQAEHA